MRSAEVFIVFFCVIVYTAIVERGFYIYRVSCTGIACKCDCLASQGKNVYGGLVSATRL